MMEEAGNETVSVMLILSPVNYSLDANWDLECLPFLFYKYRENLFMDLQQSCLFWL